MQIYGYLAAIFMGFSLGLVGGGGSILTVPILVYLFLIDPVIATSSSLFIVGSTALVGAFMAYRRDDVEVKAGIHFFLPGFLGVFLTKKYLVPMIPETIFTLQDFIFTKPLLIMSLFSVLMLMASFTMIRSKKKSVQHGEQKNKQIKIGVQGFMVGVVTGFVGAGGGFLIIPALLFLTNTPMKIAVGTSLFIVAIQSLLGFLGDYNSFILINWPLLLKFTGCAIVGLFIGNRISLHIAPNKLKVYFGYFILCMGIYIIIKEVVVA